ncbi:XdhC family protein [Limibaculum sp. M0105]|uniref:XdhC family protein n=1 Tax=Thermohalobaculum xanthum TaxID=2753746 RepID=A0A8J7M776_9RHOB|nr:XdhC family protein [Thermohalobaculum xanthum]MBK0399475.1 XdhC family protein [Thermohalobaculum xanthum]
MTGFDIFDTIERLRRAGRPFCLATVVRTADVTSAKAGAKAAVTEAGEIIGHLGGGCVQRAVRSAAAEALSSGETRLIRVKPAARVVAMTDADGVPLYRSGCPSGGTVDILIEAYSLPPQLVIFGASPIAQAIASHGVLMGYRVAMAEDAGAPEGVRLFPAADPAALGIGADDFVVVASQGQNDLAALRAALDSPARHVAMVASRIKAKALTDRLAAEGMPADRIARLKSPAGLDLGGIDPHEIAVSVIAEIVRWRNRGGLHKDDAGSDWDTSPQQGR